MGWGFSPPPPRLLKKNSHDIGIENQGRIFFVRHPLLQPASDVNGLNLDIKCFAVDLNKRFVHTLYSIYMRKYIDKDILIDF